MNIILESKTRKSLLMNLKNKLFINFSSPYSSSKKSYLITHGWNGAASNPWVLQIKNSLLTKVKIFFMFI